MRRILLLITDLEIGGTPTVVRELAVRLHRPPAVAVEVTCLAGHGPVVDQLQAAGITVTPLQAAGRSDIAVAGRLSRLIADRRYDTVFSFLIHANAIAASTSLAHRSVRFLQSIQTTQPYPRWHWWLQAAVHRAADKIVVPSPSVAQMAEDRAQIPAEKIVVIPNAIDLARFRPSVVPAGSPHPYPVAFIGRLDPIKRLPDLIEAVRLLEGCVHLHVYGAGTEQAALRAQSAGLPVTFHGSIDSPGVALQSAGALILPSDAEGFGLVLIEAMAARVPVIATNVAGIRDVVRPGITGLLVPPRSPGALAEAISKLISNPSLRAALTAAALEDVGRRFTWQTVLPQYQRLLDLA